MEITTTPEAVGLFQRWGTASMARMKQMTFNGKQSRVLMLSKMTVAFKRLHGSKHMSRTPP